MPTRDFFWQNPSSFCLGIFRLLSRLSSTQLPPALAALQANWFCSTSRKLFSSCKVVSHSSLKGRVVFFVFFKILCGLQGKHFECFFLYLNIHMCCIITCICQLLFCIKCFLGLSFPVFKVCWSYIKKMSFILKGHYLTIYLEPNFYCYIFCYVIIF
jgi:hypothetical protein